MLYMYSIMCLSLNNNLNKITSTFPILYDKALYAIGCPIAIIWIEFIA